MRSYFSGWLIGPKMYWLQSQWVANIFAASSRYCQRTSFLCIQNFYGANKYIRASLHKSYNNCIFYITVQQKYLFIQSSAWWEEAERAVVESRSLTTARGGQYRRTASSQQRQGDNVRYQTCIPWTVNSWLFTMHVNTIIIVIHCIQVVDMSVFKPLGGKTSWDSQKKSLNVTWICASLLIGQN